MVFASAGAIPLSKYASRTAVARGRPESSCRSAVASSDATLAPMTSRSASQLRTSRGRCAAWTSTLSNRCTGISRTVSVGSWATNRVIRQVANPRGGTCPSGRATSSWSGPRSARPRRYSALPSATATAYEGAAASMVRTAFAGSPSVYAPARSAGANSHTLLPAVGSNQPCPTNRCAITRVGVRSPANLARSASCSAVTRRGRSSSSAWTIGAREGGIDRAVVVGIGSS